MKRILLLAAILALAGCSNLALQFAGSYHGDKVRDVCPVK